MKDCGSLKIFLKRVVALLFAILFCFTLFGCDDTAKSEENSEITAITVLDDVVTLGVNSTPVVCKFTLTPYNMDADVENIIKYCSMSENVARIEYVETNSGVSFSFKVIPVGAGETYVYLKLKNSDVCSEKIRVKVLRDEVTTTTQTVKTTQSTTTEYYSKENVSEKTHGNVVYVTPTGKKYHFRQTCAGKNAIGISYEQATQNYSPCKKCAQ